jgi:hypothetical protein
MPVNYLNIYVFAIFGGLAATVGGIFICYTGMSETSYLVYRGMELTEAWNSQPIISIKTVMTCI